MVEVAASAPASKAANAPSGTAPSAGGDPSKTASSLQIKGAPFRITPLHSADKWFKALFYAKHGIGKTELAGTSVDVPEMRDVLYLNVEGGDMTLTDSPRIQNADRIFSIEINDFATVTVIRDFLRAYCAFRDSGNTLEMKRMWAYISGQDVATITDEMVPIFRTVVMDTLTEVDVYSTYQILKIDIDSTKLPDEIDTAGWPEFRRNNEMMKLLIRAYRDLPMHVIFLCSELYKQDEMRKFHYYPNLTGQLGGQVQGFVDMVGYLVAGEATEKDPEAPRRLFVQPIGGTGVRFDAKNRRSVYRSAFFHNPTMEDIMKGIGLIRR